MSNQEYIKSILRGAELYREQGLLAEARLKYLEAMNFLDKEQEDPMVARLKKTIETRVKHVERSLVNSDKDQEYHEVEKTKQNLIKELFSFSPTREVAALEGAVALWKFGQHRRALGEFEKLLEEGSQRLSAAKYILLCLLTLAPAESVIARLAQWEARRFFSGPEMRHLREFLHAEFRKRGLELDLPPMDEPPPPPNARVEPKPQISSITIDFEHGPLKGRSAELTVAFQFGNVLSVLVPALRKDLIEALRPEARFPSVGVFSSMAFFRSAGTVSGRTKIKHGPTQGDYLVDITIEEG
jgi:tetratricopeptide (TPR) repeat protein